MSLKRNFFFLICLCFLLSFTGLYASDKTDVSSKTDISNNTDVSGKTDISNNTDVSKSSLVSTENSALQDGTNSESIAGKENADNEESKDSTSNKDNTDSKENTGNVENKDNAGNAENADNSDNSDNSDNADNAENSEKPANPDNPSENTPDAKNPSGSESKKSAAKTVITIEKAQKTSTRKDTLTGNNIIVLTGGVSVSVKTDTAESIVSADLVNYDRQRNIIYAEGNVSLKKKTNGADNENLTAESLLMNTETLEGVFSDGRVVQLQSKSANIPDGSTMAISADLFGRDDTGTITFKNGSLTLCDEENPHWKINASRIWLLSGNEFAFANAVLFIGNIPVVYLPFFYYPKDEMIFNPVFGYRQREGYFVQTTTYIIGRKPLDTTSSSDGMFDFMKETELKRQERQGLFLHNLSEAENSSNSNYLKIYADYYTNLGGLVGASGVFKPKAIITDLEATAQLGFSRVLFPYSSKSENKSVYLPVDTSTGVEYWDSSNFIGLKLPFRYAANLRFTLSYSPFRLTVSMPVYSDSYFKTDFLDRSEYMDWINFLIQNPALTSSSTSTTTSEVTSFTWRVTGSITPTIKKIKPYVNNFSLSNYEFNLNFNSKTNADIESNLKDVSPSRKFFYPSTMAPAKASVSLGGTIFSWPLPQNSVNTTQNAGNGTDSAVYVSIDDLDKPDELQTNAEKKAAGERKKQKDAAVKANAVDATPEEATPEEIAAIEEQKKLAAEQSKKEIEAEAKKAEERAENRQQLTNISASIPSIRALTPFTYSLTYSVQPVLDSLITYSPADSITIDTIKWDEYQQSYYKITTPIVFTSTANLFESFFLVKNDFNFNPVYQTHPVLSDKWYTQSAKEQIMYNDFAAQSRNITNTNSISFMPFAFLPVISKTSVSWNTTLKLLTTTFTGTAEKPEWEYEKLKWEKDYITAHNLTFIFNAEEGKFSQIVTIQSNLPPLLDSYSGKLTLNFPYVSVSGDTIYKKKSETDDTWVFSPFNQSSSIKLFDSKLSISQSFQYNIEESKPTSFQVAASFWGAGITYLMMDTNSYTYTTNKGWVIDSDKDFRPYSINLSFSKSGKQYNLWKNRINIVPSIQSSMVYDLIRATNSYFTFSPSLTLKIYEFASLTFSSSSRNDVIFRYVQDISKTKIRIPGETNPWQDLVDSFNFGDELARQQSGFKLKSFSLKLEHYLHDWTLSSSFTITPRLIKTSLPYKYDFSPYFSLSVLWKPMKAMKTTIVDEYGELKLNPSSTSGS